MNTCKKYKLIILLAVLIIATAACTPKKNETQAENTVTTIAQTQQSSIETSFDYSKILNGDLSEFAGYWVNNRSERALLAANGAFSFQKTDGDFGGGEIANYFRSENIDHMALGGDVYLWNFYDTDYFLVLYPAGVEIIGAINPTDNSRVRIFSYYSYADFPADISEHIFYWTE